MCRIERWSVRTLRAKIGGMLFERTALSRKPEVLVEQELAKLRDEDTLTPDLVFRDPYFLDFLGLKDTYSEKDLEAAILREMEQFILELGAGFTFVARQKRIVIDGEDFYLDLLFYHRKLRRLIAVELKLGDSRPPTRGRWSSTSDGWRSTRRSPAKKTPMGLILCADKGDEQVELLQLDKSGIRVASYLTDLPPRQLLQRKLHEAMIEARAKARRATLGRLGRRMRIAPPGAVHDFTPPGGTVRAEGWIVRSESVPEALSAPGGGVVVHQPGADAMTPPAGGLRNGLEDRVGDRAAQFGSDLRLIHGAINTRKPRYNASRAFGTGGGDPSPGRIGAEMSKIWSGDAKGVSTRPN